MGVDISFIIPNKLRSKRNHKENVRYLDETIAQVKSYFRGKERFVTNRMVEREDMDYANEYSDDEDTIYSFEIPILDAELELRSGYWDVETYVHYCRYFLYRLDKIGYKRVHLRETCFDIARILGYDEAWVCDEFHSWNCDLCDNMDATFNDWLKYDGAVNEYDISIAKSYDEKGWPDYESKYHDVFKECKEQLNYYQKRFPTYEILTLSSIGDYLLAAQGDNLYLI